MTQHITTTESVNIMETITIHSTNITRAFSQAARWAGKPVVLVHTSQELDDGAYDFRFEAMGRRAA